MDDRKAQLFSMFKQLLLGDVPGPVTCEGCGGEIATHADAINAIPIISVGVPGHPAVGSFQCPDVEHWACSPNCWERVAYKCISEHMKPILEEIFQKVGKKENQSHE